MAIYFGDELRSSNTNFPIIDISENNAKGVVFIDDLSDAADWYVDAIPYQKITVGLIVVDRATGNVYVYKGAGFTNGVSGDGQTQNNNNPDANTDLTNPNGGSSVSFWNISTNSDWKVIGNTPVFGSEAIIANIGSQTVNGVTIKNTFGKFKDGEAISFDGLTALDAIKEALTSYQDIDDTDITFDSGVADTFPYSVTARLDNTSGGGTDDRINATNIKFKVRNRNRGSIPSTYDGADGPTKFGIKSITIDRVEFDDTVTTNVGSLTYNAGAWVAAGVMNGAANVLDYIEQLNERPNGTTAAEDFKEFIFNDNIEVAARQSGGGSDTFAKYEITVVGVNGDDVATDVDSHSKQASDGTKGSVAVTGYAAPTISVTVSRHSNNAGFGNMETDALRAYGNVKTNLSVTVTKNDDATEISSVEVERQSLGHDGQGNISYEKVYGAGGSDASDTTLATDQNDESATNGPEGTYTFFDTDDAAVFYDSATPANTPGVVNGRQLDSLKMERIRYRVTVTDDGGTAAGNETQDVTTIYFYVPAIAGYSSTNPVNTDDSSLASAFSAIFTTNLDADAYADQHLDSNFGDFSTDTSVFFRRIRVNENATNCAKAFSSSYGIVGEDVFVNAAEIGSNKHIYMFVPNAGTFGSIKQDNASPVLSDFQDDGQIGRGENPVAGHSTVEISLYAGAPIQYTVYAAASEGSYAGSYLATTAN